jgi:hypothetical protein
LNRDAGRDSRSISQVDGEAPSAILSRAIFEIRARLVISMKPET